MKREVCNENLMRREGILWFFLVSEGSGAFGVVWMGNWYWEGVGWVNVPIASCSDIRIWGRPGG